MKDDDQLRASVDEVAEQLKQLNETLSFLARLFDPKGGGEALENLTAAVDDLTGAVGDLRRLPPKSSEKSDRRQRDKPARPGPAAAAKRGAPEPESKTRKRKS